MIQLQISDRVTRETANLVCRIYECFTKERIELQLTCYAFLSFMVDKFECPHDTNKDENIHAKK